MTTKQPLIELPRSPIYGLTWSIPEKFGGMTSVLLHRCSTFARLGGRTIDILTLKAGLNLPETMQRLRDSGHLVAGVRLRNMWEELSSLSDRSLREGFSSGPNSSAEEAITLPYQGQPTASRLSSDGEVLQVDTFRPDGTRLASERRDVNQVGTLGGRQLALFCRDGEMLNAWVGASDLHFAWLDYVIGEQQAFLINDSQFIGASFHRYRRKNVVTVQVIHSSHLDFDSANAFGRISKSKLEMAKGLRAYDMVAVLTPSQAHDLRKAHLVGQNVCTIPNSRSYPREPLVVERDANDGVMLARLEYAKRVDHAVGAFVRAHAMGCEARLRIFGDGSRHDELQQQISEACASTYVQMLGFRAEASRAFRTASFSVLSSRFEGLPLVVIESMAAGCIPVAYDVRYGPGDIITDGVNGFLVPPGDVEALSRAIAHVSSLDHAELAELRRNAQRRAAEYDDEPVTVRWVEALVQARSRKVSEATPVFRPRLDSCSFEPGGLRLRGSLVGEARVERAAVFLGWSGRAQSVYGRIPMRLAAVSESEFRFEIVWPLERSHTAVGDTIDFHIEVDLSGALATRRLPAVANQHPLVADDFRLYATTHGNVSLAVAQQARSGGLAPE